jgi:hypothetical protein
LFKTVSIVNLNTIKFVFLGFARFEEVSGIILDLLRKYTAIGIRD